MNRKRQSYVEGALTLIVAGFIVKVIGAVFKIPLYNVIGGQAMSYFTVAYDVYVWMYIITTAGLPVGVSRMVSESNAKGMYDNSKRILFVATVSFSALGVLGFAFLFYFASRIADVMGNPSSTYAIKVIAPAILFEIIMSAYRGYYQGNQNMVPTAISQILVALAKLSGGVLVARYILRMGLPQSQMLPMAAAGAISGVTLGTVLGALYLVLRMTITKGANPIVVEPNPELEPHVVLLRRLVSITLPIAVGSMVASVSNLVDTSLIMRRLIASGVEQQLAETLFGTYSGMARTLFNLPSALIIPIGISAIPTIAESFSTQRKESTIHTISSTLRLSTLLSMPAGFGFIFMAGPVLSLLYGARPAEVAISTPLLSMLGFAVTFICLDSITNSVLQAIGLERVPVITMLAGGLIKILSTHYLVAAWGITGAPISTILCYLSITIMNFSVLRWKLGKIVHYSDLFIRPAVCSVVGCGCSRLTYAVLARVMRDSIATAIAIGVAVVLYVCMVLITRALRKSDVLLLPFGEKMAKTLEKRGWIR